MDYDYFRSLFNVFMKTTYVRAKEIKKKMTYIYREFN